MVIFRWLYLFSSTEATLIDELQFLPDRTIRSWPVNRWVHMPKTYLGTALSRQQVYPPAFTSTILLPMAFEKKKFPPLSLLSFNLVKIHNSFIYYLFHFIKVLIYASLHPNRYSFLH